MPRVQTMTLTGFPERRDSTCSRRGHRRRTYGILAPTEHPAVERDASAAPEGVGYATEKVAGARCSTSWIRCRLESPFDTAAGSSRTGWFGTFVAASSLASSRTTRLVLVRRSARSTDAAGPFTAVASATDTGTSSVEGSSSARFSHRGAGTDVGTLRVDVGKKHLGRGSCAKCNPLALTGIPSESAA